MRDKYTRIMTSQVSSHGGLVFSRTAFCCGNKIAYCSANSITLEGPYHFSRSGGSERGAPWHRDHHQLTVAGEFEIKAVCAPRRSRLEEE